MRCEDDSGNANTASTLISFSVASGGGGGDWPNEPAGYTQFNDQPWNSLASNGWNHLNRSAESVIVSHPAAPFSPNNVLEFRYPVGFPGGYEPSVDWIDMTGRYEYFAGFWFKASDPWQGHSTMINKIIFFNQVNNNGQIVLVMRGPAGGPYYLQAYSQGEPDSGGGYLPQNVNQVEMVPGRWYRIEVQLYAGTNNNGIVRWWQDGVLLGDHTDLSYNPGSLDELCIAPTWGGQGGSKTESDYFRIDHFYISVP